MNKKNIITIALAAVFVVVLIGTLYLNSSKGNAKEEVVASINGVNITKDQLYDALVKESGQQTLEALISDKIIELELQKQNITVSEEETQAEIQKTITQFGGQEAFDQALQSYGYSLDDIKKDIQLNLKVKKMLEPQITITDEEMKAYFEENKAAFNKEDGTPSTYEESKDIVKETLSNEKLQAAYGTWYDAKYNEYKVENFLAK